MPIVVDGALCRTEPTKSDPTQPANVQKNLSQPDPLILINICIQYYCKIFTICIDLHSMYNTYHKVMIRFAKTAKKCDPIRPVRGSINLPVIFGFFWCLSDRSSFTRNRAVTDRFRVLIKQMILKKPDEPRSIPVISGTHTGIPMYIRWMNELILHCDTATEGCVSNDFFRHSLDDSPATYLT